ncbi:MAG: hypothetical protein IIU11_02125 [Bacteroidales bacterium]|jgi:hypothetical protein|nr:hypothetical protein [Bacteroidales bacterium]MBR6277960.1 hypothetical protein [Bacteroidales bacterium]
MNIKLRFFKSVDTKVSRIFALVFFTVFAFVETQAQQKSPAYDEAGLFLGAGYYNGEINPTAPLYKPKFACGLVLRHGFNERMALSFNAVRCKLEGSDKDFADAYRRTRNASFENEVTELAFSFEYNFLPLIPGSEYQFVTPYVAAGLGLCVASFPNEGLRCCVPFGIGVKIAPKKRFTLGIEWKYRKVFSDMLDQIGEDTYSAELGGASKQKSFLGNDDWYSFVGVVLMFRLGKVDNIATCPAYRK